MVERCTRCILPETIPGIRFDDEGVCNHCLREQDTITTYDFEGKDRDFEALMEEQRSRRIEKGLEYDVCVAVSGGRDSSYVVLKLVRDYGLKVLCVNYDNPFTSKQARENVHRLVESLKVDLVVLPDRYSIHLKSFAQNLKAWMRNPDLGSTGLICIACQSIYFGIFDIASKNNIEVIVAGANPYEITGFKAMAQGVEDMEKNPIRKLVANYTKKLMKNRGYIRPINIIPALKAVCSLYGESRYLKWRYPNIRKTAYFYHFHYDEAKVMNELRSVGWEQDPDNPSPWRFDCEVDSVKNYIYRVLVGATEKDDMFSRYIRAGLMSRDEAMERVEKEGRVNREIVERVLGTVGISIGELDRALERARNAM